MCMSTPTLQSRGRDSGHTRLPPPAPHEQPTHPTRPTTHGTHLKQRNSMQKGTNQLLAPEKRMSFACKQYL